MAYLILASGLGTIVASTAALAIVAAIVAQQSTARRGNAAAAKIGATVAIVSAGESIN